MRRNTFAVYKPPAEGLPYLAVMVLPSGRAAVEPFPTLAAAEQHNRQLEAKLYGERRTRAQAGRGR